MLIVLLASCGGGPAVAPPARPDVVLVTLDTTRADHLGSYGDAAARTDTLDALAARGLRFARATSPLPLTIPAHSTILTGLLPFHHGVRDNGSARLEARFDTLAEILHGQGWATGASVAAYVTTRRWGFSQGFDAYFDALPEGADRNHWHTERAADAVVDDALAWLADRPADRPVFLWVHLYDAHYPYAPPSPYAEAQPDRPYDAELAFVDDQVGRLVDAFAGREVLWVVVGDHGEAFGEHDEQSHGLYAYEATQHVPWLLAGPGVAPGVDEAPVSTADVLPTVLRALGLPVPDGLDGRPQPGSPARPYAESYQLTDRFRIAPHRALIDGDLKLVATPRPELYDLRADPHELHDLASARPADVARLQGYLDALGATPPTASNAPDAETVAALAALGYVSVGPQDGLDPVSLPDPKDHARFLAGISALDRAPPDDPQAALAQLDALIALKPDAFDLQMRRLPLLEALGRQRDVEVSLAEAALRFPDQPRVWLTLSSLALQRGDAARAVEHARRALDVAPTDPSAREGEVRALLAADRVVEALAAASVALRDDPGNDGIAALVGLHAFSRGDAAAAEPYLRRAAAAADARPGVRVALATLAARAGQRAEAVALLEVEVQRSPGELGARRLLARLYGEEQRWDDQLAQVAFVAKANPADPLARLALAQCLFNLGRLADARSQLDLALAGAPEHPDVLMLHANLLAKEGHREEGMEVLQRAQAAHQRRLDAARGAP